MKTARLILAAICLLLPIAARTLWFYQGIYHRAEAVEIPPYEALTVPMPQLNNSPVAEIQPVEGEPVVVFDIYHYGYYNLSEIDLLTRYLTDSGAQIEVYDGSVALSTQLMYADSYVVIAPTILFTIDESDAVNKFVEKGGHLLVVADPTRNYESSSYYYMGYSTSSTYTAVDVVNILLDPYDIAFQNDYAYNILVNEGNYRNVYLHPNSGDPLLKDISTLVFYGAHSLVTENALIEADDSTYSSFTDTGGKLPMAATSTNGRVLAIGDMSFMTAPFYQVEDNQQFILNIADFLSTSERVYDLLDYPYIFGKSATILTSSENAIDPGQLALVLVLKQALEDQKVSVSISSEPVAGSDSIYIGTFPPGETLQPFVDLSGLVFEENEESFDDDFTSYFETAEPPLETPTAENTQPTEVEEEATEEYAYDYDTSYYDLDYSYGESGSEYVVTIPGLGNLEADSFGFFIYLPGNEGNTYIFLVKSADNYQAMADLLVNVGLSSCSLIDNVVICEIGDSNSSYY